MSGIYIPKMKLPRNCGECPFFVDDGEYPFDEDGTWCGRANYLICDGKVNRDSKPEWCDLVPVPDHSDLIERDTLCKVLQRNSEDEWNKNVAPFSWSYAYECVKDTVENMPTIIPADKEGEG